jgi:hypothetical protein
METKLLIRFHAWIGARRKQLAADFLDRTDFGLMGCAGCTLNCQQGRTCASRSTTAPPNLRAVRKRPASAQIRA